ncbi:MAG: peptide chain release factor N(5)-glutamine methyltransferase [Deltaproteobacteria bacterium]|nr:peptide chain release factor N(5)-glutamine methyltransferase [Deltaproteobacteria bacterium]
MIVHDILNESTKALEAMGIPSARLDAEVLLSFCLGCDRLEFFKNPEMTINEAQLSVFRNFMARRLQWEPVAYITGRKEFWSLTLEVNKTVLIPRPDTEIIVEEALNICREIEYSEMNILDIGTGSGAIAIALAKELPNAKVMATDISEAALNLARKNADTIGLTGKINFRQGDLFEPVEGIFDIIVCNPPYISAKDYEKLPAGVKDYEPPEALLAGKSGLEFYKKLIYQAAGHLKKNGWLLLEIGAKQEADVRGIMESSGCYNSIEMRRDYAGLPRVIKARRKVIG